MTQPTIQPFFVFSPEHMSWENWNGNIIISYGEMNIPYKGEEDWKDVARFLTSNTAFSQYPTANPEIYDDWRQWAYDFTQIINGPSY